MPFSLHHIRKYGIPTQFFIREMNLYLLVKMVSIGLLPYSLLGKGVITSAHPKAIRDYAASP
jgi:hypothetical protein